MPYGSFYDRKLLFMLSRIFRIWGIHPSSVMGVIASGSMAAVQMAVILSLNK